MLRFILLSVLITPLAGCDLFNFEPKTADEVCKKEPLLCSDLNTDGWCSPDRSTLILNRYAEFKQPSNPNKFFLMRSYQTYGRCIELAATIEPKYNKHSKTQRVEGMLTAVASLEELEILTADSNDPFLLMYHWTELRDDNAKTKFLALEGTAELNHPDLQWTLATYYSKRDLKKSIGIFKRMFRLYPEQQVIPAKVPEAIIGAYMGLKQYKNAYLWALISQHFSDSSGQDYKNLEFSLDLSESERSDIKNKANTIYQMIEERTYPSINP